MQGVHTAHHDNRTLCFDLGSLECASVVLSADETKTAGAHHESCAVYAMEFINKQTIAGIDQCSLVCLYRE